MSLRDDFRTVIQKRVYIPASEALITPRYEGTPEPAWIFDFRAIMLESKWVDSFAELFWERYADRYPFQVGGLEAAAIGLVAAIAAKGAARGTPVSGFFIRKSRKRDGLMKFVEGTLTDDPIILVDDIVNSGQTFERQINILESLGKKVSDACAILAYRSPDAYRAITDKGIRVESMFTLEDFGLSLLRDEKKPIQSLEIRWKFESGDPSFNYVVQKSAPVTDGERVYFGSDRGIFWAINCADGSVAWKYEIGPARPKYKGIFSSPALHQSVVYFGGYDGALYALDAQTGSIRWKYDEADWIGSSPALAPDQNLVFIGLEFGLWKKRGGIAALRMRTGERVWIDRTTEFTHGSPLYIREEGMVLIGSNDGIAYAYDANTGVRRWLFQTLGDLKSRAAYDPVRRLVMFASMDERIYAVSAPSGEPIFGYRAKAGFYSTPLVHGDVAYVASLDKSIYCIDLETGRRRWKFDTSGRIFASPVIADGSLWIGSNDGCLYELDPMSGSLKGFLQLSERIVNAIAYDKTRKHFFITTVANELYCAVRPENASSRAPSAIR